VVRFAPVPSGAVDGGHPGWARLTDAERSVAEVVAAGYTNREAATTLFLSPHTVDYHLRHIFRKLDIDSRIQLASIAEQHLGRCPASVQPCRTPDALMVHLARRSRACEWERS
jgi:DNA-binding CsgD family transcriptional regulator